MKRALNEWIIFKAFTNNLLNKIVFVASQFSQTCVSFKSNSKIKKIKMSLCGVSVCF